MTTSVSTIGFLCSIAGLVAVALFNAWTSRINQFFFFSRTVDPDFQATAAARRITNRYAIRLGFGLVISVLILFSLLYHSTLSFLASFLIALLVEGLCNRIAFGRAHQEAGALIAAGSSTQQATLLAPKTSVSLLDPGALTGPRMLMLALALATAALAWIVPMAAMQMGLSAFGDAISAHHADFLSGLGLGLIAGSVLLFVQLRYFSRHRSPLARFTATGCVQLAWLGAVCNALSTLSVPFHYDITREFRTVLLGLVLATAILRLVYGWTKAKLFPPPAVERNGDQFWRWGMFYYNPSDPTLFIQHRCGPGYTVNFANRMSWALALFLAADVLFLVFNHLHR